MFKILKMKKLKQKEIIEIIECLLSAPTAYYDDRYSHNRDKQDEQIEFRNSIIDKLKKGVYYE